jgi:hypothetical protein
MNNEINKINHTILSIKKKLDSINKIVSDKEDKEDKKDIGENLDFIKNQFINSNITNTTNDTTNDTSNDVFRDKFDKESNVMIIPLIKDKDINFKVYDKEQIDIQNEIVKFNEEMAKYNIEEEYNKLQTKKNALINFMNIEEINSTLDNTLSNKITKLINSREQFDTLLTITNVVINNDAFIDPSTVQFDLIPLNSTITINEDLKIKIPKNYKQKLTELYDKSLEETTKFNLYDLIIHPNLNYLFSNNKKYEASSDSANSIFPFYGESTTKLYEEINSQLKNSHITFSKSLKEEIIKLEEEQIKIINNNIGTLKSKFFELSKIYVQLNKITNDNIKSSKEVTNINNYLNYSEKINELENDLATYNSKKTTEPINIEEIKKANIMLYKKYTDISKNINEKIPLLIKKYNDKIDELLLSEPNIIYLKEKLLMNDQEYNNIIELMLHSKQTLTELKKKNTTLQNIDIIKEHIETKIKLNNYINGEILKFINESTNYNKIDIEKIKSTFEEYEKIYNKNNQIIEDYNNTIITYNNRINEISKDGTKKKIDDIIKQIILKNINKTKETVTINEINFDNKTYNKTLDFKNLDKISNTLSQIINTKESLITQLKLKVCDIIYSEIHNNFFDDRKFISELKSKLTQVQDDKPYDNFVKLNLDKIKNLQFKDDFKTTGNLIINKINVIVKLIEKLSLSNIQFGGSNQTETDNKYMDLINKNLEINKLKIKFAEFIVEAKKYNINYIHVYNHLLFVFNYINSINKNNFKPSFYHYLSLGTVTYYLRILNMIEKDIIKKNELGKYFYKYHYINIKILSNFLKYLSINWKSYDKSNDQAKIVITKLDLFNKEISEKLQRPIFIFNSFKNILDDYFKFLTSEEKDTIETPRIILKKMLSEIPKTTISSEEERRIKEEERRIEEKQRKVTKSKTQPLTPIIPEKSISEKDMNSIFGFLNNELVKNKAEEKRIKDAKAMNSIFGSFLTKTQADILKENAKKLEQINKNSTEQLKANIK